MRTDAGAGQRSQCSVVLISTGGVALTLMAAVLSH